MRPNLRVMVLAALLGAAVLAGAQAPPTSVARKLGEVLDQGARRLSAKDFVDDVVQRNLWGQTPAGGQMEFMYAPGGTIAGLMTTYPTIVRYNLAGEWAIETGDRICTATRVVGLNMSASVDRRCQYWYKLGDTYYVSDSDSDRSARVIWRKFVP